MTNLPLPNDPKAYMTIKDFWERQERITWKNAHDGDRDATILLRQEGSEGRLSAERLRSLFGNGHCRAGVIGTVMWGYPNGRRGHNPCRNFQTPTFTQAGAIWRVLHAFRDSDPLPAKVLVDVLCGFDQIGPSTATKLLFMADIKSIEGPCLILDQRVVRAISRLDGDPDFGELTQEAVKACTAKQPESAIALYQKRRYGAYIKATYDAAERRSGVTARQIEQFLLKHGGGNKGA